MFVQNNKSAVKTHYLSSILPFNPLTPEHDQVAKNKDFFKPDQFIWNNPHRTSKRMYKYYHQFNDTYEKELKPQIQKLEENDRIMAEQVRIKKLTNLRHQTRNNFHSRVKMRQQLEMKAGSRQKQHSTLELNTTEEKGGVGEISLYLPQNYHSLKIKTKKDKINQKRTITTRNQKKHISITEQTFRHSAENYDHGLQEIKKLVNQQLINRHDKIRQTFKKRRTTNQQTWSRIKRKFTSDQIGSQL